MLNTRTGILIAIAVFLLSSACTGWNEAGEYHPVDVSGWEYGDTLRFNIESADSVMHGDLAVVVRHTASYPYSNIWLEINYPQADSIVSDSINIVLADDYGNWLGRGAGLSFQRVDTVLRDITITTPATVSVRHIMRVDKLSDIEQLGVILTPQDRLN